jgi:IS6 family transposase
VKHAARSRLWLPPRSAFTGFRFPPEVIVVAVRWYLRYGLSCRDVEQLLAERGIEVDPRDGVPVGAAVHPAAGDAARFTRHWPGDRWFVDETCVKVNGVWRYVYRAVDQDGQVIDVLLSARRDAATVRRFFTRATRTKDHGQLKRRLRPMRGLQTDRSAQVVITGHAFVQNPAPWPLRHRTRHSAGHTARRRVHRTRPNDLSGCGRPRVVTPADSPIEASSGKTRRRRLNRGGDRRANAALYRIALTRSRGDHRTRDYLDRRATQGLTRREAIRCLKRYIAREIYQLIQQLNPTPAPQTA